MGALYRGLSWSCIFFLHFTEITQDTCFSIFPPLLFLSANCNCLFAFGDLSKALFSGTVELETGWNDDGFALWVKGSVTIEIQQKKLWLNLKLEIDSPIVAKYCVHKNLICWCSMVALLSLLAYGGGRRGALWTWCCWRT